MRRIALLALLLLLPVACASSFSERHYFKSVDAEGNAINYFRVRLSGNTFLSSSRYLSGYFDERAVDAYFSQISQPKEGEFKDEIATGGTDSEPMDETLGNRRLVLLLSSNADAIAEQIGQFADNEQLMADLTRLVYRDRIVEAREAWTRARLQKARGKSLGDLGKRVLDKLDDGSTDPEVAAGMLFLANRLAAELGNRTPFTDLDQAATWLAYNRGRVLED